MKKISFNLENKNIVITGGNGFLGSQITDSLLYEKANVYIIDINNPKKKKSAKYFKSDIKNYVDLDDPVGCAGSYKIWFKGRCLQ